MLNRLSSAILAGGLMLHLLVSGAAAQPPVSCEEEVARLRYLTQHYQAGRTAAEFEVARLQALTQALQREVERLRQTDKSAPSGQIPGGLK